MLFVKWIKVFCLVTLLWWCQRETIFAIDTGLNLIVSPLPISLTASPGATVSAQLKIKNGGAVPETLTVGLMKFSAFGDEGSPRLMDREKGDDYFDWVKFSENEFVLNPNEWKTITATITVPQSVAFGYYYAVTFQRKNEDIPGGPRSTKIVGATATLILLEVPVPNAIREVEVLEFFSPQKIYEFLPTKFFVKLKNKGNVHVAPRGNIFIDGMGQKDVAILNINDLKGNVLPNSNRIFETEWTDGFPVFEPETKDGVVVTDSHGKPKLKIKWDLSTLTKLRFGKYTANMLLVYDDGKKDIPIEGKLEFLVIPWRLLGIFLIFAILIVAGLWSIIKSPIKKVVQKIKNK